MTNLNTSYILSIVATILVIELGLLPTVFSGFLIYILTLKLTQALEKIKYLNIKQSGRWISLSIISCTFMILSMLGISFIYSKVLVNSALITLYTQIIKIIQEFSKTAPAIIVRKLPTSTEAMTTYVSSWLSENIIQISSAGTSSASTVVHMLLGVLIGGMVALHAYDKKEIRTDFLRMIYQRLQSACRAFERVIIAQVQISALNSLFTMLYLSVLLPVFGIYLPFVPLLVFLTFILGLIPMLGNLLSNCLIVTLSLGISFGTGIASLAFLVFIHKVEYFLNAKIIGTQVDSKAWELLCAMLVFEAAFGFSGLIAAPVVYTWIKDELKTTEVI